MKWTLSILLAAVLVLGAFSGCSCASTDPETITALTPDNAAAQASAPVESDAPETSEPTGEADEPEFPAAPVPEATPTPTPSAAPAPEATASPTPEPTPTPTPEPAAEPTPQASLKEIAQKYVGSSVSSLYAAIGYPGGSDYAPSCLGHGEDGQLYYGGFTVATYREGGAESVRAVY